MKFNAPVSLIILITIGCSNPSKTADESPSSLTKDEFPYSIQSKSFTKEGAFTSGIEGPAVNDRGVIFAVNFGEQGTIGQVTPEGDASLFVKLPEGSIGNGIRIDQRGTLFIADYTQHNVLRIDPITKEVSVYAHQPKMNQPNDLAIMQNGTLFASDPNWKESTGQLWRIDTDGTTTLLEANMGTTNGIEVSPDEKHLYVNESVQRTVWQYDLQSDGRITNKQLLIQFEDFGMDGMRADIKGNLYITRYEKGSIAVISPEGKLIREVQLEGKKPSNIAFGGPDGRTCYVTLHDKGAFESFRAEFAGRVTLLRQ